MPAGYPSEAELDKLLMGGGSQGAPSEADLDRMLSGAGMMGSNIIEEQHPDIDTFDRLVVKNFSNDPTGSINYLQKKYPKIEFKSEGSRILAKNRDKAASEPWNVLDPDTGIFSDPLEFAKDVGDIGWDVGAGLLETAASGAGGVAGALSGAPALGIGAVPGALGGAALAGGAASGGLESARQTIGQAFGVAPGYDPLQIGIATGMGAASPLLFGTGATGKQAVKGLAKEALKQGATQEGAEQFAKSGAKGFLRETQRGGLSRTLGALGKGGASAASGVSSDTIESYLRHSPEVRQIEKRGVSALLDSTHKALRDDMAAAINAVGKEIETSIDDVVGGVNISEVKNPLLELRNEIVDSLSEIDSPAFRDQLYTLDQEIDALFTTGRRGPAQTVQNEAGVFIQGQALDPIPDIVSAKTAFKLQESLSELAELSKMKGGLESRFGKTQARGSKRIAEAARQSYQKINDLLDSATEGLSSDLKTKYREHKNLQKALSSKFSDLKRTYDTLRNLGKPANKPLYETMQKADKMLGTDLVKTARIFDAFNTFVPGSTVPLSAGGATSTSRSIPLGLLGTGIGGYIGLRSGEGYPGSILGGGIGGALGASLGGPRSIRLYLDILRQAQKAQPALRRGAQIGLEAAQPAITENYR